MFRLSNASLTRLRTVDPRLQRVMELAIELTSVDFMITQGLRTLDEQARLYGKGRTRVMMAAKGLPMEYAKPGEAKVTWTMNSNHMSGRAVDVAAWVNGKIDWDNLDNYHEIAKAVKAAAATLNIPVDWGGDWKTTKDLPHFELRRED